MYSRLKRCGQWLVVLVLQQLKVYENELSGNTAGARKSEHSASDMQSSKFLKISSSFNKSLSAMQSQYQSMPSPDNALHSPGHSSSLSTDETYVPVISHSISSVPLGKNASTSLPTLVRKTTSRHFDSPDNHQKEVSGVNQALRIQEADSCMVVTSLCVHAMRTRCSTSVKLFWWRPFIVSWTSCWLV